MRKLIFIFVLCAVAFAACKSAKQGNATSGVAAESTTGKGANGMNMAITSTAFADGTTIPKKYSCDGSDMSPPLTWTQVPQGTKSFALIMDDPDAPMGTWVHWVMWNIPPTETSLPEGMPKDSTLTDGSKQGKNSWPKSGYGGPCPPPGKPHRYFFKLYALDTVLNLPDTTNKSALESAVKGHIVGQAQIMGTYGR